MFGKRVPGIAFKRASYLGGITDKAPLDTGFTLIFEADQVSLRYLGRSPFLTVPRSKILAVEITGEHRDKVEGVLGATYTTGSDHTDVVLHTGDGTPIFRIKGVDRMVVRGRLANWLNASNIALLA